MSILQELVQPELRVPGFRNPKVVAFRFTTNGSGVPTLADDYKGQLSTPVQATNDYTVTVGAFEKCVALVTTSVGVRDGLSLNTSAGTVQLQFSAAQNNAIIDVILLLDVGGSV
jgi:hypothetical protein